MRISEMKISAVLAEAVDIDLWRVRRVPADPATATAEHWEADPDAGIETVGLRMTNAAFARLAEHFGSNEAFNAALFGTAVPAMEPALDDQGNQQVDPETGRWKMRLRTDQDGKPQSEIEINRAKGVQESLAILLHRDEDAVGAAMMPELVDVYFASLVAAMNIGRGVDPSTVEQSTKALLALLGVTLEKTTTPPSDGQTPGSPAEEPSQSSGE